MREPLRTEEEEPGSRSPLGWALVGAGLAFAVLVPLSFVLVKLANVLVLLVAGSIVTIVGASYFGAYVVARVGGIGSAKREVAVVEGVLVGVGLWIVSRSAWGGSSCSLRFLPVWPPRRSREERNEVDFAAGIGVVPR